MRIVVCYKGVPEEQDIMTKADRTLDLSGAAEKIGQYDLNAIEAAVQLKESGDHNVTALTVGGKVVGNSKLKKGILSRGPDKMLGVQDSSLEDADTLQVAAVITEAVKKLGGADLLLFGEGSGDSYAQQTGNVAGALLGWPTVNAVQNIELQDGKVTISRSMKDGVELLEVPLPAVLTVTSDINIPRIPSMKEILGAGKKPSEIWKLSDLEETAGGNTEVVSLLAPEETERKQIILGGDVGEQVDALYQQLRKLV